MRKLDIIKLYLIRKKIEILSVVDNFGLKFIRAVSRRGLVVKIILSLLAFNIYQLLGC